MKKNFSNLFSDFYEKPNLDSAWDNMRTLLDEQLPVQKKKHTKQSIVHFISSAAMIVLLLVPIVVGKTSYLIEQHYTLFPNDVALPINLENEKIEYCKSNLSLKDTINKEIIEPNDVAISGDIARAKINNRGKPKLVDGLLLKGNFDQYQESDTLASLISFSHIKQREDDKMNAIVVSDTGILTNSSLQPLFDIHVVADSNELLPIIHAPLLRNTFGRSSQIANSADSNKKSLNKIGFNIGLYHNVGGSAKWVYPMLAATIPVNKKYFISLGVGFNSQMRINNFIPKEFTIINDTLNQVYFTLVQNNISKAVYTDLPVAINYKINNRFSMNAGVQISILQKVDMKSEEKLFDFQSNLSQQLSTSIFTSANSYTPNQVYSQDYTFLKTNGRFTVGVGYQLKDLDIKFQYAKSFSPNYSVRDFDGSVTEKKLSSFTVGLNYRIKKL